ncbi:MAG TPA: hypothetical protein VHC95_09300 [Opitutales bacterium]|nr:hypothetical protein [Opitutales bacterium]
MKIVRDDSMLQLVDSTRPLGGLALVAAMFAGGSVFYKFRAGLHAPGTWLGLGLMLAVGVAVSLVFFSKRDFQFDKAARKLTWRRRLLLSQRGGEMPFADITDAVVEVRNLGDNGGKAFRLVLKTAQGPLPVCDAYTTGTKAACETAAARIREILRDPKA